MAECYEKLGDPQTQAVYQRLLRDYADQAESASAARARLRMAAETPPSALTTQRVLDVGRSWDRISPDGRYLARPDQAETGNLTLFELETGEIRQLTSDGSAVHPDERFPLASAFSRDGSQIAYEWMVEKEGRGTLRIIETAEGASKAPRTVYENPDVETVAPTDWSPDGRWIAAVIRRKDATAQVGVISVADGSLRVLKTVDWSRVGGLRFSPDSSFLAYHRPATEGGFERDVFVLAVDGSREVIAASSPGDDFLLEWTTTGDRLVIASERGGSMSAWTVPAMGPGANSAFELVKSDIGTVVC